MGNGFTSSVKWDAYASTVSHKNQSQIFTNTAMADDLDPKKIVLRESCDSTDHPVSTPIILGIDQTGSMGKLAVTLIKDALGKLILTIMDRQPVNDPHVMCAAIGDANFDRYPFQVTQFEADTDPLVKQIASIHIEGGGGGNGSESYDLTWWFAANRTKCDSMLKRKKKGILITMGDEGPPEVLYGRHITAFMGGEANCPDIATKDMLAQVTQNWEVFHLMVAEGDYMRYGSNRVIAQWRALLGERAILLSDYTKMAEVIVSLLQVLRGDDVDTVSASWSGNTSMVVRDAIKGLTKAPAASGVVRL